MQEASPDHAHHSGHAHHAAPPAGPRKVRQRPRLPRHHLHLPDAPGDPAGPSRQLSQVRHDAGAGDADTGRRRKPRAGSSADASGGHCRSSVVVTFLAMFGHRSAGSTCAPQSWVELVLTLAGRPLGRLAVLRARRAVDRQPQPQHVDADRPGHRRGLRLQRGRDGRDRRSFPPRSPPWAAWRCTSRPRRSSSR